MQGRLSPPPPDRIQAFPRASWEAEFGRARFLGYDAIEWLVEEDEQNPIWSEDGRRRIRELVEEHGVAVDSVCGDLFMTRPLHRGSEAAARSASIALCPAA